VGVRSVVVVPMLVVLMRVLVIWVHADESPCLPAI
jgi:hypothetical protein